jgi:hypothetical protein
VPILTIALEYCVKLLYLNPCQKPHSLTPGQQTTKFRSGQTADAGIFLLLHPVGIAQLECSAASSVDLKFAAFWCSMCTAESIYQPSEKAIFHRFFGLSNLTFVGENSCGSYFPPSHKSISSCSSLSGSESTSNIRS